MYIIEERAAKMSLRKVIMLAISLLYLNTVQVFGAGIDGISAYSTGGAIMQSNDLLTSGSQLNWSFANISPVDVTLMTMQLIDGVTGTEGNLMSVNQLVGSGETVSYTTTIGALGIHVPVTCRFRYNYNGVEYYTDATYTGSYGPIGPSENYTLSIKATGNGHASYNGTTIRNSTKSFNIQFLGSATISFTPDNGYRIKSVKVNNSDVTSKISYNQYSINVIMSNQSVEVEFEAIPISTFNLTIKASGNGYASYNSNNVRSQTSTFTVNENTSATISFAPDNGYRIKSVKVNNSDVTSKLDNNNQYTINNISKNTSVEVEFEAIPITYTLTIKATGNGSASYNGTSAKNNTQTFTLNEGASATISFTSDNGYRIKSVKVNNTDVTSNVSNNKYTINNIHGNTSVDVEFEAVPIITYNLSITAIGYGSASYDGTTIRDKTNVFTINEGTSAIISFSPDNGYRIKSVKVNNTDVTSNLSSNKYTINNISGNTSLEVEFAEEIKDFESNGIYYSVVSGTEKTIRVSNGNYGLVLEVPEEVTYQNINWKVVDIDNSVLSNNSELAAIIWNPSITFNTKVSNPNLLLYVKDKVYTSSEVKNTVVNGIAENIELIDATSSNNFYCPRAFTAKKISYTHDYKMETGFGESKGWETVVLPFDVQKYIHSTKGEIEPFTTWNTGSNTKPFWLFELTASGYKDVASIKANTPYIISMPNNKQYEQQYQIPGIVTFSASNVEVQKTDDLKSVSYQGRTFVPNYTNKASDNILALNVNSYYVTNSSTEIDGSKFIRGLRAVHPFEAYMTTTDGTRSIDVLDGMTTAIKGVGMVKEGDRDMKVYDTKGVLLKTSTSMNDVRKGLKAGVYIVNGKKVIIK